MKSYPVTAALVGLALFSASLATGAAAQTPDWNGVWETAAPRGRAISFDPETPAGQVDHPPLTPEYAARYQQNLASRDAGKPRADPTASCMPPGTPRIMGMLYGMQILMTPGEVTIIAEWMEQVRHIYTDGRPHPAADQLDPSFNGHSIGHWEGDTLVVDTVGLRSDTLITQAGIEHSDATHLIERWRMNGDVLEDRITLDDPKMLTQPWTVTKHYKRAPKGTEIKEYVCEENNHSTVDKNGVAGIVLKKPAN